MALLSGIEILSYVSSISEKIGRITTIGNIDAKPHLRKNNRIKSIHSSLKIEANPLSLGQVRDVINGKTVLGEQQEIQEVTVSTIEFKSGNRLEIDFSEASSLKIGKNSIGSYVKSYTGRRSEIDPDVMFSLILGQELIRVEIDRIAEIAPFDFTGSRGIPEPNGAQFIEGIRFVFANGYQLRAYPDLDYGEVELLDEKGEPVKIYWKELKHGVTEEFQIITQQD